MGRKKGRGTIYKKPSGVYYYKITMPDGSRVSTCCHTTDRDVAEKMLEKATAGFEYQDHDNNLAVLKAKLESSLKKSKDNDTKYNNILDLSKLHSEFTSTREGRRLDAKTLRLYKTAANNFSKWMSENHRYINKVYLVTDKMVMAYVDHLKTCMSTGSINNYVSYLRVMCRSLSDRFPSDWKNPWDEIDPVYEEKPVINSRRCLTDEEVDRLIKCCKNDDELRLIVCLCRYEGMRIEDACNIMWRGSWSSVDLDGGMITYTPIKKRRRVSGRPIVIPIHPIVRNCLEAVKSKNGFVNIYISPKMQKRHTTGKIADIMTRLFKRAGIDVSVYEDGIRRVVTGSHSLRHTFVCSCLDSGMSPALLASLVGHSSLQMSMRYYHANMDNLKQIVLQQ